MYSIELGNSLRAVLFNRNDAGFLASGSPVTYDAKPGQEATALATWAVHGVCLECRRQAITDGRCAECSKAYRTSTGRDGYAETDVRAQCDKARQAVNEAQRVARR